MDWKNIGQPFFDRVIETMAPIVFPPPFRVNVIEGKGGDGGRDIEVFNGETLESVLQLKYFPEGFSGSNGGRKNQIRNSWNSLRGSSRRREEKSHLWPNGKPKEWILVVPCKLTDSNWKFLNELVKDSAVLLFVWDQSWLDSWLAKNPGVADNFANDFVLERAKLLNQEKSILSGGLLDLDERARGLKAVTDAVDPHWTMDLSISGDKRAYSLIPKHPAAFRLSPIAVNLKVKFGPKDGELKDSYERFLNYGTPESVTLPEEVVEDVNFSGSVWLSNLPSGGSVEFSRPEGAGKIQTTWRLQFLDEVDRVVSKHESSSLTIGAGALGGMSLTAYFHTIIKVTLLIDFDRQFQKFEYSVEFKGASVFDAVRGAKLIRSLSSGGSLEMIIDGRRLERFPIPKQEVDPELELFMDIFQDLEIIEKSTGLLTKVPQRITLFDRINLRMARLLLEGKSTFLLNVNAIELELRNTSTLELGALAEGGTVLFSAHNPDMHLLVAGVDVSLGEVIWWHPKATIPNYLELISAIKEGKGDGISITIIGDGTPFRGILATSVDENAEYPSPSPWALRGVAEPKLQSE